MSESQRSITNLLARFPAIKVVLSDAVQPDSYYHVDGPDGGTLYVNAELTAFIAAQDSWTGTIVTSERLPEG